MRLENKKSMYSAGLKGRIEQLMKAGRVDQVEMLLDAFNDLYTKLSKTPAGAVRASFINKMIDDSVKRTKGFPADQVQCKKGCSLCCHIHVGISTDEAKLLALRVKKDVPINRETAERQAKIKDPDAWAKLPNKDTKCVFLNDSGECRVYEDRPSACRSYFVLSDPKLCDKDIDADVTNVVSAAAEIWATVGLNLEGCGSLPKMLLKELDSQ
jgi:Fe-S-cluster containining protein